MKKLKVLVWSMCLVLGACAVKPTTEVYTSERGTQWEWNKGTIVVHTPERPAGQKNGRRSCWFCWARYERTWCC